MIDEFEDRVDQIFSQARRWAAVVPSDTEDFEALPKALWVNGAGNIRVTGEDDHAETFAVLAGQPIPIRPRRVLATGTTATGILALF